MFQELFLSCLDGAFLIDLATLSERIVNYFVFLTSKNEKISCKYVHNFSFEPLHNPCILHATLMHCSRIETDNKEPTAQGVSLHFL